MYKGLGLKKMEGALRRSPDGMEVPVIGGSDCIRWIEVSVPSPSSISIDDDDCLLFPPAEDYASSSVIGEPPIHFVWRIHKASPKVLELLQLSAQTEFPATGLRFVFAHALSPFAFVFAEEGNGRPLFSLYAVTLSGVVYVLRLSNTFSYISCSIFPHDHLIHLDVRPFFDHARVTILAASPGCLFLGRSDGSVSCFRPALSLQALSGFHQELRDDVGFGRLWGLVSRGRMVGAVQDLFISNIHGGELMFVLHADGTLRVWDLLSYSRVFCHSISASNVEGLTYLRLWLGKADYNSSIIPLAVLYKKRTDISVGVIGMYGLHFRFGDRTLSLDSGLRSISLEEGEVCDVKLTSDKIWILKGDELLSYMLFHKNSAVEAHHYTLQEEFISDQLFLSSKCCLHDLLLTTHSLLSSTKDQIMAFVSSIFIRRLFCPGVFHNVALRLTLLKYNKHWTDSEFQSLNVDELKNEILLLVEHEVTAESSTSVFHWWKNFCSCYLHHCRNNNQAQALLVQSDVVGLVRKNSLSVFRGLEDNELSIGGFSYGHDKLPSLGAGMSDIEHEILLEVLGCIAKIDKQMGGAPCAIYYESFTGKAVISSDEIVPCLVKILESGYALSVGQYAWLELGADKAWAKELEAHKILRTFSIDMLLSLSALCQRAGSWEKAFTITERYLQYLVPKKFMQNGDVGSLSDIFCSILVQATSQFVKVMFESAFNTLLFISYLLNVSGQLSMSQDNICKLRLELLPMIQEIVLEWLIILFFVTTPAESTSIEDFNSKLSSLQINSHLDKRAWNTMLGKCGLSLAFILLFSHQSGIVENHLDLRYLPSPQIVASLVQNFISWTVYSKTGEDSSSLLRRSSELSLILIRNGQSDAVERFLEIMEASLRGEKTFGRTQDTSGDWCLLQHLHGCCLLDQAQRGSCGVLRGRKISEAIRCFFRASSGEGASKALHSLSAEAGLSHVRFTESGGDISNSPMSSATWKLHYYEWAMQNFERYNISEGACQFAFAALEQVDEALNLRDSHEKDSLIESATATRGRLWANVFKFTLDLNLLNDAYCAIISNPDEEIKRICLRRFIIVLFECGKTKILSDGHLPFIGLAEKITQELAWKAERSDIMTKPNPYKLLYAYEMQRHNWRMAASYMYQFSARLRSEAAFKDYKHLSLILQERLNGLSASINALCLVHPAYSWIDPLSKETLHHNACYPVKRARKAEEEHSRNGDQPRRVQNCIDIGKLQNEFVLTSAEYLLSLKSIRWRYSGCEKPPSDLVDLLVQANLYDMAFTVVLKFWRGSTIKRELEKIFESIAMKCCPSKAGTLWKANDLRHNLLLTSSDEEVTHGSPDRIPFVENSKPAGEWEILELYLEKYKDIHPRLPLTVAATILRSDPYVELPLWLVHMFKAGQKEKAFGMAGQESSPASLFQLYVDCGRLTEATNLLLEYMELFASMKPADVVRRKKASGVWFPYTAIERLWCQLEKAISERRMMEQCEKLKTLVHRALLNHLKLLKGDSDDAVSSAAR